MNSIANPFAPAFGYNAESYVAFDSILAETDNLVNRLNPYYQSILISGVRGTGKSALIARIREGLLRSDKTISIDVTAHKDQNTLAVVIETISYIHRQRQPFSQVRSLIAELSRGKKFTLHHSDVKAQLDCSVPDNDSDYRTADLQLRSALDKLNPKENLILITLDEAQNDPEGVASIISSYQVLQSLGYRLVLIVAGLPELVDVLFTNPDITFYRRVNHIVFNLAHDPNLADFINYEKAARHRFVDIFVNSGRKFSSEAVQTLDDIPFDYLFLYQTLGYALWSSLSKSEDLEITAKTIQQSLGDAKRLLFNKSYQQIWKELASEQHDYLAQVAGVISHRETPNWVEIAAKCNCTVACLSDLRERLMQLGYLEARGRDNMRFALPYFAEFVMTKTCP